MLLFGKCFLLFGTNDRSKLKLSLVLELFFIKRSNHPSLAHCSSVNGLEQFRGLYLQPLVYLSIAVVYKLAALCTLASMFSLNFSIKVSLSFKFSIVGFLSLFSFSSVNNHNSTLCYWREKPPNSQDLLCGWLSLFFFPNKISFLWAVFSILLFSPELCQKMALLCDDSPISIATSH